MKSRFAVALSGVLVTLSLAACGGHATATPTYYTPPEAPSLPISAYATQTATPTPAPTQEPAAPAAPGFTDWLATNYPGVSWASLAKSGSEHFGVLWIETDIYPDGDAPVLAQHLCTAGRAYALETGAPYNGGVSVRASTGLRLYEC